MTQEQIAQCQEAGNEAYEVAEQHALMTGVNPIAANVMCADAYRAAYKKTLAGIVEALEREAERQAEHPTSEEMIAIVQEALTQPAIEY